MIKRNTFTKEWILSVKGNERSDQGVIEKQIFALHLLEELNNVFPSFVFKGGTALSLISDTFPRFSVDIDILVDPRDQGFFTTENLGKRVTQSQLKGFGENIRQPKRHIDKQHFEFYFESLFSKDALIMLDIVYAPSHYRDVVQKEIDNHLIDIAPPKQYVNVPSVHDLLSDKLCAFAPKTIGKKLNQGRDVEVIKQMYDVAFLFRHYPMNPTFCSIYEAIATHEIKNRVLDLTYQETILDTVLTSLNILTEGKIDNEQYPILKDAIRRFKSYVRNHSFTMDDAKMCAIDTVYAGLLVLVEGNDNFMRIASEQQGYLEEYRVFVKVKKWLRLNSIEYYDVFDQCLKVMSHLNIRI
jgi:predicted nucleotidyltransferase component of viral defense system